jgi:hypothetical protein
MIATRSLGFRAIGTLIWAARHELRPFCIEILKAGSDEDQIRFNAWRVLIFIGHPELETVSFR